MTKQFKKNVLKGIAAAPGIIISKAYLYKKDKEEIFRESVDDAELAIQNLKDALEKSKKELKKIFELAVDKMGEKRAGIFEAQLMILDDPVLLENVIKRIKTEKLNPEFVISSEISKYQDIMDASSEPYMKERSHDIEDIKNRIIRNLRKKKWKSRIDSDVLVVTDVITPADTVLFTRVNVKGYITDFGGLTSHAAIVARSLNIPAVVGLHDATSRIRDNDTLIVDGINGIVIINPDEEQLAQYKEKIKKLHQFGSELLKLRDKPSVTTDGKKIVLQANVDLEEELEYVVQNGAEGIGLVRTEQLFQVADSFPDEETQFEVYSKLAEKLYPNEITIRTFDIGGDKVLPLDIKEPNPFLGWRGIRFLLDNEDLFKTQLRALLRASSHRNIKVMFPMIGSIKEIRRSKKIIEQCKAELKDAGQHFDNDLPIGIMIEVPSAAVMAGDFAAEVDFVSIGTNDLIQYILAVDRGNENVFEQYQEFHPAIVRTLKHIITEGKKNNATVSICGEMAADILAVPLLIGLGLDSLSVSSSILPHIKKIIRSIKYSDVEQLANECLKFKVEEQIKTSIHKYYKTHFADDIQQLLKD